MPKRHLYSYSIIHGDHKQGSAQCPPVNKGMNEMWADNTSKDKKENVVDYHSVAKEEQKSCYLLGAWNTTVILVLERIWAMMKSRAVWATGDPAEMN